MNEYDDEIRNYFLENQRQLFPENVAELEYRSKKEIDRLVELIKQF